MMRNKEKGFFPLAVGEEGEGGTQAKKADVTPTFPLCQP